MIRFSFLLFFSLIISSCGDKTGLSPFKKATPKPTSLQLVENGCYQKDSSSPVTIAVQDLVMRFDRRLKVMREVSGLFVKSVSSHSDHFKSTPFKPHYMSEVFLEKKRLKVERLFNSYISQENKRLRDWEELARELKRLQGLALRWQAQRCSLKILKKAQSKDLRQYVLMLEKEELYQCSSVDNCKLDFVKSLLKEDRKSLLSLCEYYKKHSFCVTQLNKTYDKPEVFYNYFMDKHKKRYDKLFVPSKKRQINCDKEKNNHVLTVRIKNLEKVIQKSGLSEKNFKKRMNSEWGEAKNIEIKLLDSAPYNVIASFKSGHLSFVNDDEVALMTLSNTLFGEQLINVFSHELGHVFGFADCYVEFYDNASSKMVYYSLDKLGTNKMCEISTQSRILKSYKERLIEHFCN